MSLQHLDLRICFLILYAEKSMQDAFQILTQAQGIKLGFVVFVFISQGQY